MDISSSPPMVIWDMHRTIRVYDEVLEIRTDVRVEDVFVCSLAKGDFYVDVRTGRVSVSSAAKNHEIRFDTRIKFDDSILSYYKSDVLNNAVFLVDQFNRINQNKIDIRLRPEVASV